MVYCTNCGTENEEGAVNCKNCEEPMTVPRTRRYRRRRADDDICFGSQGGNWFGIFIGLVIILAGASELFKGVFWWASWDRLWPFVVIIFGLIIVVNTLSKDQPLSSFLAIIFLTSNADLVMTPSRKPDPRIGPIKSEGDRHEVNTSLPINSDEDESITCHKESIEYCAQQRWYS